MDLNNQQFHLQISTNFNEISKLTYSLDSRKKSKNFALPDTLSRNTPPELITRKDETSPRLQGKYTVKTDLDQSQMNNLQLFPLYLDCQNNHYEVDFLGKFTFKLIRYSSWIRNNTHQKPFKQKLY